MVWGGGKITKTCKCLKNKQKGFFGYVDFLWINWLLLLFWIPLTENLGGWGKNTESPIPSTKLFFGFSGKRVVLALIGKEPKPCMRSELDSKQKPIEKTTNFDMDIDKICLKNNINE